MRTQLPSLSDSQLEIVNVVWGLGECTVADVLEQLRKKRRVARNTVQTMMSRLDAKGWLAHREDGGRFVYSVAVPRESVQRQYVEQVVKTVFDGSAEGLVLSLLRNRSLSRAEADSIRRMIRDAEERS